MVGRWGTGGWAWSESRLIYRRMVAGAVGPGLHAVTATLSLSHKRSHLDCGGQRFRRKWQGVLRSQAAWIGQIAKNLMPERSISPISFNDRRLVGDVEFFGRTRHEPGVGNRPKRGIDRRSPCACESRSVRCGGVRRMRSSTRQLYDGPQRTKLMARPLPCPKLKLGA